MEIYEHCTVLYNTVWYFLAQKWQQFPLLMLHQHRITSLRVEQLSSHNSSQLQCHLARLTFRGASSVLKYCSASLQSLRSAACQDHRTLSECCSRGSHGHQKAWHCAIPYYTALYIIQHKVLCRIFKSTTDTSPSSREMVVSMNTLHGLAAKAVTVTDALSRSNMDDDKDDRQQPRLRFDGRKIWLLIGSQCTCLPHLHNPIGYFFSMLSRWFLSSNKSTGGWGRGNHSQVPKPMSITGLQMFKWAILAPFTTWQAICSTSWRHNVF